MNIEIICIGKLKERYWAEAAAEYGKRLGRFCRLSITELEEGRLADGGGAAAEAAVIEAESESIIRRIEANAGGARTIALDVKGKERDSKELAAEIARLGTEGKSRIIFIIGGSLGLSEELLARTDERLSFSRMTFPHQLMRVILLEQLYRAFKINSNEKYHK